MPEHIKKLNIAEGHENGLLRHFHQGQGHPNFKPYRPPDFTPYDDLNLRQFLIGYAEALRDVLKLTSDFQPEYSPGCECFECALWERITRLGGKNGKP